MSKELTREIADHKRTEENLSAAYNFLEITNRHTQMKPLLKEFIAEVKRFTGCTAIGIRILDKKGYIPYRAYDGFSKTFYDSRLEFNK